MANDETTDVFHTKFKDVLRGYRSNKGKIFRWWDCVAFFIAALAAGLSVRVSANGQTSLQILGSAYMGLAGAMLGVAIAGLAIATTTLTDKLVTILLDANGYPALLIPFWLTGLSWAVTVGVGGILLLSSLVSLSIWLDVIMAGISSGLLALSITWTMGLFGSVLRFMAFKAQVSSLDT